MSHFYLLAINKPGLRAFNKGVEEGSKMDSSNNSLVVKEQNSIVKKEDGNMDSFARNLVELRKKAGLTQEELASKLGLSAQSISKYETGAANPDISYLPGLADALGVTIDRLFGRETVGYEEGRKPKKILVRVNSEDGDKVKAYVFFRGRSILFKEQGEVLLLRFANDLEDCGKVEQMPVLEGKRMTIFIAPKKGGVSRAAKTEKQQSAAPAKPKEASEEKDGKKE